MNIFKKIFKGSEKVVKVPVQMARVGKDAIHLVKAAKEIDDIKEQSKTMDSKSLFKSKTFWLNALGLGVQLAQLVPPKYGMPALAIVNLALRLVTEDPVHIFKPEDKS